MTLKERFWLHLLSVKKINASYVNQVQYLPGSGLFRVDYYSVVNREIRSKFFDAEEICKDLTYDPVEWVDK